MGGTVPTSGGENISLLRDQQEKERDRDFEKEFTRRFNAELIARDSTDDCHEAQRRESTLPTAREAEPLPDPTFKETAT